MRLADPFAVLGLGADADAVALRRAYLALTKVLHPSKFARHGEKVRELAHEVFLLVRRAHDQLEPDDKRKAWRDRVRPQAAPATIKPQGSTPVSARSGPTPPGQASVPTTVRPASSSTLSPPTLRAANSGPSTIRPPSGRAPTTVRPSSGASPPSPGSSSKPGGASPSTIKPSHPVPPGVHPASPRATSLPGRAVITPAAPLGRPGTIPHPAKPTTPPEVAHGIEAARLATRDREHRFDQARKFLLSGQARAAREILFQIASEEPGNRRYRAHLHMAWGFEHVAAGKLSDAQRELEKALILDPDNDDTRGALAKVQDDLSKQQKGLLGKLFRR
jgi:curved DNA-binding protein CbpA